MQIAQVMAGYSLGGADLLRRAMGKKIKEAMDEERPKFLEGAAKNDVPEAKAREVWDLLEKFANYGFNKSHAAAYAYVSYQTGYLKANHPVEFMAAVMNLDMHNTDKLSVYRQELQRMRIDLAPPDVNASAETFTVEPTPLQPKPKKDGEEADDEPLNPLRVRYALGAVKNVGRDQMRLISEERQQNGAFKDLFDFARRVELKLVGRRALENLARAGAFDSMEPNRRRALEAIEILVNYSAVSIGEARSSQSSLFGAAGVETPPPKLPKNADWGSSEKLAQEMAAIGFYISGHPLDDYAGACKRKRILTYKELCETAGRSYMGRIAAVVTGRQERKSQRGNPFAFVQLSDATGIFEAVTFSEVLNASRDLLEPGRLVALTVNADRDGDQLKLRIDGVQSIEDATASAAAAGFRVHLQDLDSLPLVKTCLETLAGPKGVASSHSGPAPRGYGPVEIIAAPLGVDFEATIALEGYYPVGPQSRQALKGLGVGHVEEF